MTKRRIEWRLNYGLSDRIYKGFRFHDLFVDDEYQHIWLRENLSTGKFELSRSDMDTYVGEFDSTREAEEYLIALDVVERFERAYG